MAQPEGRSFFEALNISGRSFVVILPNNDPGAEIIFSEIEQLPKDRFRVLPSMRFGAFLRTMFLPG